MSIWTVRGAGNNGFGEIENMVYVRPPVGVCFVPSAPTVVSARSGAGNEWRERKGFAARSYIYDWWLADFMFSFVVVVSTLPRLNAQIGHRKMVFTHLLAFCILQLAFGSRMLRNATKVDIALRARSGVHRSERRRRSVASLGVCRNQKSTIFPEPHLQSEDRLEEMQGYGNGVPIGGCTD